MIAPSTIAIIDLGSNTFHLLIVALKNTHTFEVLYRERVFTRLSEGGLKTIDEGRFTYGIQTISHFADIISNYPNCIIKAVGTAVLRSADNSQLFISEANALLSTQVEIIGGSREAELIFQGMMWFEELNKGCHLIMDIGGGSTEFIIVNDGKKMWSESYVLGVGHLHHLFHKSDPISTNDISALEAYIHTKIGKLVTAIDQYKPTTLVGASGSFEVLESMCTNNIVHKELTNIDIPSFHAIADKIERSTLSERMEMEGLPRERTVLIVVGMLLKKIIINIYAPQQIIVSPYALKEGIIREILQNNNLL